MIKMTGAAPAAPVSLDLRIENEQQVVTVLQDQIIDFVTDHSRIGREQLLSYMMATGEIATDVGTVLYGPEAVECGLIEQVGNLRDALDALHEMIAAEKNKK